MRDVSLKPKAGKDDVLDGIKIVIFDLDGTLYDKTGLAARMVRRLWWCLPLLMSERLARQKMHGLQYTSCDTFNTAFFATMARGHWWGPDIAQKWYDYVYLPAMVRVLSRHFRPRPEAMELIEACKQKGLKMAIYSDYGCVVEKLKALRIDPKLFDLMVDAPSMGALKPSKQCAEKVMLLLHAEPETTLFVGDRDDKDGETARVVGAKYWLINGNGK